MGLFSNHKTAIRKREFEQLFDTYSRRIYSFAMRLSGGDTWLAEEVVQTTFMRLWEHWDSLDDKQVLQHGSELSSEQENRQDAHSLETYLKQLVENMPPMRKKVFIMSRYEHKPNKEIAAALGISEKTVEVHITLALRELRERLND